MKRQLVVTNLEEKMVTAYYEDDVLEEIYIDTPDTEFLVGDIYIGKVKNIVPNIKAAFVEIRKGVMGYYSMNDNSAPIFLNVKKNDRLVNGDEILVQIEKENLKTKEYTVTGNLEFTGHYVIMYSGREDIRFSSKIRQEDKKEHLKSLIKEDTGLGFLFRTQSQYASDEAILKEIELLTGQYQEIITTAKRRTCFSKMKTGDQAYMQFVKRYQNDPAFKFTTDIQSVYDDVKAYKEMDSDACLFNLVRYHDESYSLLKLKGIETDLSKLKGKHAWLKSGGYLVIEPTEALTVIDVNTGKAIGKNDQEANFLKINMEAAREVARQIRLRNISGIIIVDFINMKKKENMDLVWQELKKQTGRDNVPTSVVDRTALQLVEITRKKVRRPLHEQLA